MKEWSDLIDLENIETIAWEAEKIGNSRPFRYAYEKSIEESYVEDFGLQWTSLYGDYRHDRYMHLDQFLRLGIHPIHTKNLDILDAGCGLGRLSELCCSLARRVVGAELSDAIRTASRFNKNPNFFPLKASIDNLPLKEESFDIVFSWGVIHHTPDPAKTLAELWRVLKPGGLLAIWVYPDVPGYQQRSLLVHHFSKETASSMLNTASLLTSVAHMLQKTSPSLLATLRSDLCFTVKKEKESTRLFLYDGLGPEFHFLLNEDWFRRQPLQPTPAIAIPKTAPFAIQLRKPK